MRRGVEKMGGPTLEDAGQLSRAGNGRGTAPGRNGRRVQGLAVPAADAGSDQLEEAIAEYRRGRSVIVVDHERCESEGHLTMAAPFVTPEAVTFMLRHTSSILCVSLPGERLDRLGIPQMVDQDESRFSTAFAIPVDARKGVTSGASATDRARTIRVLVDVASTRSDLVMPGHVYPLRSHDGGVIARSGLAEAGLDLCRLADLPPAAVLCELMNPDGSVMQAPKLRRFAARHSLKIVSIDQLIRYRLQRQKLVERVASTELPTRWGNFALYGYRSSAHPGEHAALVMGDVSTPEPVLARIQPQCVVGEVFRSLACDCRDELEVALERIADEGRGALVYVGEAGGGLGRCLGRRGREEASGRGRCGQREGIEALQILRDLGAVEVRLMTDDPEGLVAAKIPGLEIAEPVALRAESHRSPVADAASSAVS